MYEFLQKFSHKVTPLPTGEVPPEEPHGMPILRRNFIHVSRDLY
jgi:hypothetical protein